MSTPETIYLIPGEYEEGLVWCDDPAPDSYSDPGEAVKYVRADTLPVVTDNGKVNVGLIAENERLQAQVVELVAVAVSVRDDLLLRSEIDSDGTRCVNLSASKWSSFCDVIDDNNSGAFITRKQAEVAQAGRQAVSVPNSEYIRALQDAFDIIQADANTEENYGSLCRIGSVLAKIKAGQEKSQ